MDPKNLAVLQKLKESMSASEEEQRSVLSLEDLLRRLTEAHLNLLKSDSEGLKRSTRNTAGGAKPAGSRSSGESSRKFEFRGVLVSEKHYKALVEAASGRLNTDRLIKLEALAFYLEKAPGDKGAMNVFGRISGSSDPQGPFRVREAAKKRVAHKPKPINADTTAYGLCSGCGERLLVDQNRRRNTLILCGACKGKEQDRRSQAFLKVKSNSGAGRKIAKLEAAIDSLRNQIAAYEMDKCPVGLRLSLLRLESAYETEKIHAVSGLNQIRCSFVSGSTSAGRRR